MKPKCMLQLLRHILSCTALLAPMAALAIPEGPAYPSAAWTQREAANYAMVLQAPLEEAGNPAFLQQFQQQSLANLQSYIARDLADPSWLTVSSPAITALVNSATAPATAAQALQSAIAQIQQNPASAVAVPLNAPLLPLCTTWSGPCTGDPYLYPGTDSFYTNEADVIPVVFYDDGCARLSGRVWAPKGTQPGANLPAVVIENGSIEAPETLYWWMAKLLVQNGYAVMTFDPRGQGRSDQETPSGGQGTNINSSVFWTGLVNAIDFFRSSAAHPYPENLTCAGTYPTQVAVYNPISNRIDPNRLGIAGHSLGATGVSVVQGYGAPGAAPWPGKLDASNPVKVTVAWDGLLAPDGVSDGGAGGNLPLPGGAVGSSTPNFGIRVPAMNQASEYGLAPVPFTQPPNPDGHKGAFAEWVKAGVPVYSITIQGSTHYEWSLLPLFPASSWCPSVVNNACVGGWGNPLAQYYTLAWFDRWLKHPGETGYDTADARLLDDSGPQGAAKMSFYYRSARSFSARDGSVHDCADIRAGCSDIAASQAGNGSSGGGGMPPLTLLVLLGGVLVRRARQCKS
ncbi:MAG: alpha/beta hydrolase family protein [Stenotrophobium sp.]